MNSVNQNHWVRPSERILDPPPTNQYGHDDFSKLVFIYYYLGLG